MLSSIRKFSNSIYAKILLGIIIIPFVFWGMGSTFTTGNKNVVVVIDKEKYSIQEFVNFIKGNVSSNNEIDDLYIDQLLSIFIGEKLIAKEVEDFGIQLSNKSLSQLIKNQKDFKRNGTFSRTEYEKFLLKNNLTAESFESDLSRYEKKNQLLGIIGGGLLPSKFLINISYNKVNQKKNISFVNLNDLFNKELNFTDEQIKSYYDNNMENYNEIYKSVKILELTPKKLVGKDEYTNLYFKKIDEIDDLILQGENFNYISNKFNFEKVNIFKFNNLGEDVNSKEIKEISKNLIKIIFSMNDLESLNLIESEDKYFIIEIVETDIVKKDIQADSVKKKVILNLKNDTKRQIITDFAKKINQNNFSKSDFDKLANDKKLTVKKIKLNNQNDNRVLKKVIVDQIYNYSQKKVILVHDIMFKENYLIYIDKIENVAIDEKSDEYKNYLNLTKSNIRNELLSSYDNYIKKKYTIDINYNALDTVKNYFN